MSNFPNTIFFQGTIHVAGSWPYSHELTICIWVFCWARSVFFSFIADLCLWQFHSVSVTLAPRYSLKSEGDFWLPAVIFFLRRFLCLFRVLCGSIQILRWLFLVLWKKAFENLIKNALNLQMALGRIDILVIVFLPVYELRIFFYLFVSSFIF